MSMASLLLERRSLLRALAVASAVAATGLPVDAAVADEPSGSPLRLDSVVPPKIPRSAGNQQRAVPGVLGVRIHTGADGLVAKSRIDFLCDTENYDFSTETAVLADTETGSVVELPLSVSGHRVRVVLEDDLLSGRSYTLLVASAIGEHFSQDAPGSGRPVQAEVSTPDGKRVAKKVLSGKASVKSSEEWSAALSLSAPNTTDDASLVWLTVSAVGAGPVPDGTEIVVLGTTDMDLEIVDGPLPNRKDVAPRFSDSGARSAVRAVRASAKSRTKWSVKLPDKVDSGSSLMVPMLVRPAGKTHDLKVVADLKPHTKKQAWQTSGSDSTEPLLISSGNRAAIA